MSLILAVESSCDETSAALIQHGKILANIVATQSIHEKYGGVVPELASRAHQQHIIPVVHEAFNLAKVSKNDVKAVAFTRGPGLLGALLVGSSFAKSFALGLGVPLIEVNHMRAHVLAHFIDDPKPVFPFLCLTVSGGHTQLVVVKSPLDMEVIGETQDDAVGEAFDKSAKLLGLPYPGGPMIDQHAKQGDPHRFSFSETNMPGFTYSFSGIKTSILYFLREQVKHNDKFIDENIDDLCASIQHSLINMLFEKLVKAAKALDIKHIAIAGGVAANSGLRDRLKAEGDQRGWETYIPAFQYCTDNAGMIAMAAHYLYEAKQFVGQDITPDPRLKISIA